MVLLLFRLFTIVGVATWLGVEWKPRQVIARRARRDALATRLSPAAATAVARAVGTEPGASMALGAMAIFVIAWMPLVYLFQFLRRDFP